MEFYGKEIPAKLSFRKAYGIENEVAFAADYIAEHKIPLGEAAIYYTSDEYTDIIDGVFGSKGISCALASGYSAENTYLVSFMVNILEWAKNGFLYKDLSDVMKSPILRFGEGIFSYMLFTDSVDSSLILGLENYTAFIARKREQAEKFEYNKVMTLSEEEQRKKHGDMKPKRLVYADFLEELTAVFGLEGSAVIKKSLSDMFSDLFAVVKKYTSSYRDNMSGAYKRVEKSSRILKFYPDKDMNVHEKAAVLLEFLRSIKISDVEVSNSVLAVKLGRPQVLDRKYNFFMGFSAKQFNREISESPVITDTEVMRWLGDENLVSYSVNKIRRNNFEKTLMTADKNMFISISSIIYDTTNTRPATPAPVFIELSGGEEIKEIDGYKDIVNFDIKNDGSAWNDPAVQKEKETKKVPRNTDKTKYLSHSAFTNLLSCPQRHFFEKVIGIYPPEFVDRDAGRWLPPNLKGTICHDTLDKYITRVMIEGGRNEYDEAVFEEIFAKEAEKAREDIACECKWVFESEKEDIKNGLSEYIKKMHQDFAVSGYRPVMCEGEFKDAVYKFDVGDWEGELKFRGFIDRIDEKDGQFRMIDYKTGSFHKYFKQHLIYPLAKEAKTAKDTIELAGHADFAYELIFKDEEPKPVNISDDELTVLYNVLERKDYRAGLGIKEDKKRETCEYCNFTEICGIRMGGDKYDEQRREIDEE